MKEIPLTKGYTAQVSDEDYERVAALKWYAKVYPHTVYAVHNQWNKELKRYEKYLLHHFVTGIPNSTQVDHKDHNGLNCQRDNLRPCTGAQNVHNGRIRSSNTSGYKGVQWHKKAGKWAAAITNNYQSHYLGLFTDREDAARAYDAKARELHGEFAHTNF